MKSSSLRVAALAILISVAAARRPAAPPDRFFDSNGVQIRYVEQGFGHAGRHAARLHRHARVATSSQWRVRQYREGPPRHRDGFAGGTARAASRTIRKPMATSSPGT
jgi:hypothetical protein